MSEEEDESDDDTPLQPHVAAGVMATGAAGTAASNKRKASEVDAPVSDTASKPAKVCLQHCVCDADVACVCVCFGRLDTSLGLALDDISCCFPILHLASRCLTCSSYHIICSSL